MSYTVVILMTTGKTTLIKIDVLTDKKLEKIAKLEGRTKMGMIRFLVNEETKRADLLEKRDRRSQA